MNQIEKRIQQVEQERARLAFELEVYQWFMAKGAPDPTFFSSVNCHGNNPVIVIKYATAIRAYSEGPDGYAGDQVDVEADPFAIKQAIEDVYGPILPLFYGLGHASYIVTERQRNYYEGRDPQAKWQAITPYYFRLYVKRGRAYERNYGFWYQKDAEMRFFTASPFTYEGVPVHLQFEIEASGQVYDILLRESGVHRGHYYAIKDGWTYLNYGSTGSLVEHV
jgi:hypothetical protein